MLLHLKCQRCEHTFTDEKQFTDSLSQVIRPNNSTPESYLLLTIKHAINKIKCPQCHSSVNLTDKNVGMEIDFTSQHIVQLVKSAVDLVEKGQSENVSKEYMEYASEIITELLERPGQLVYIAYPDFIRKAEDAINIIWGNVDDDELFQEIFYGKIHGESRAAIIADDYMKRAKKLRPTFLTKKPKEAISAYFQNAMECWLFGINTAALILCCSVIESLLTDAFEEKGLSLTKENGRPKGFLALTYEANKESIIDGNIKEMADDINELRRLAVHHISEYHTENIGETETYNAIMKTKKIIEKLLT